MAGVKKSSGGSITMWVHFWLLLCFGVMWVSGKGTEATAPTPAPKDCSSALLGMADCLSFVEEGSKEMKPQKSCCSGLKKVVREEVECLCQVFKGGANFGVTLNMTKALTLPAACGVKTPPLSKCNIAVGGAPGAAPAVSPVGAPTSSSTGQSIGEVPGPAPVQSTAGCLAVPSLAFLVTSAVLSYYL